eukprot:Trichotokara_eunicae@DN8577_c0_g1_i1.p1
MTDLKNRFFGGLEAVTEAFRALVQHDKVMIEAFQDIDEDVRKDVQEQNEAVANVLSEIGNPNQNPEAAVPEGPLAAADEAKLLFALLKKVAASTQLHSCIKPTE